MKVKRIEGWKLLKEWHLAPMAATYTYRCPGTRDLNLPVLEGPAT
jgi:hypothetical protein